MTGKFTLDRDLLSHDLWLSDTFSRGQAWVDLIGLATHKDSCIRVRGIKVDLKRGDVGWSKMKLAKRWDWSRGKVDRFLAELENEQRIVVKRDNKTDMKVSTVISIQNYDLYQSFGQQNMQQTDMKQDTNNNDKNDKNSNASKLNERTDNQLTNKLTNQSTSQSINSPAYLERAWDKFAPAYLKSLFISDPHFIQTAREAFVSKSKYGTQKAVQTFINTQRRFTPPDEAEYVTSLWPDE